MFFNEYKPRKNLEYKILKLNFFNKTWILGSEVMWFRNMSVSSFTKGLLFERKVVRKLRRIGIRCRHVGLVFMNYEYKYLNCNLYFYLNRGRGDNGVDIMANILGIQFIIQCKDYENNIGEFH